MLPRSLYRLATVARVVQQRASVTATATTTTIANSTTNSIYNNTFNRMHNNSRALSTHTQTQTQTQTHTARHPRLSFSTTTTTGTSSGSSRYNHPHQRLPPPISSAQALKGGSVFATPSSLAPQNHHPYPHDPAYNHKQEPDAVRAGAAISLSSSSSSASFPTPSTLSGLATASSTSAAAAAASASSPLPLLPQRAPPHKDWTFHVLPFANPASHEREIKKVAVLKKISLFDQTDHKVIDPRVQQAHLDNMNAVEKISEILQKRGLQFDLTSQLDDQLIGKADMVLSVGGDGTFLHAARSIPESGGFGGPRPIPICGVNSCPSSSYGFFSAANCQTFPQLLDAILDGSVHWMPLWRMKVFVNGQEHSHAAVNDALISGECAAVALKYHLLNGGRKQTQKSSGIWISTPAGSTAAIASAGGKKMPLGVPQLQYKVRELIRDPTIVAPLDRGICEPDFEVISRVPHGKIFLDGMKDPLTFGFGDRLSFRVSDRPLLWIPHVSAMLRKN